MKLHILQHVDFEGPGYITQWAQTQGAELTITKFYEENHSLPELGTFDLLVVMGGPMSVNDSAFTPWMQQEMAFIKQCLAANIPILGICLGAQLIAGVLGAKVTAATNKEIGWYTVKNGSPSDKWPWHYFNGAPVVFHWHGEQFEIPQGAEGKLVSDANGNQGFLYGNNVLGLQFHLEATANSVDDLLHHAADDLTQHSYVQQPDDIRSQTEANVQKSNAILHQILDRLITL
ncbi:hypothetical protein AM493_01315 [Flavobacterium akiainvivens]|uniref:Glutamine amidotransferase domain-containing protein n=1 Tax=Flavobacterium akiainvivens TaxID=1202724 RepID=A0A0M9VH26_9FLAO|nr:type 1 glutamine amidotransferase [Flavobacterium akiainvivens]KOS04832.1 hypothetical protein AM493_01315 [Flavobacterium akiainvivens]SFQ43526.1 GMP synthase-Glutamine amidotransferase [Flavobacterium akiainvivens]